MPKRKGGSKPHTKGEHSLTGIWQCTQEHIDGLRVLPRSLLERVSLHREICLNLHPWERWDWPETYWMP